MLYANSTSFVSNDIQTNPTANPSSSVIMGVCSDGSNDPGKQCAHLLDCDCIPLRRLEGLNRRLADCSLFDRRTCPTNEGCQLEGNGNKAVCVDGLTSEPSTSPPTVSPSSSPTSECKCIFPTLEPSKSPTGPSVVTQNPTKVPTQSPATPTPTEGNQCKPKGTACDASTNCCGQCNTGKGECK